MDDVTELLKTHYERVFDLYGPVAKGVDWASESELSLRYDKMLEVVRLDHAELPAEISLLDVGCGWGGLLRHARSRGVPLRYTGVDVIGSMIEQGRQEFPGAEFIQTDVFELPDETRYDFVVCCGLAMQKLSVPKADFESFTRRLIRKMYDVCRHGVALNMMSTHVNFTVDNLYYANPSEIFDWLVSELSPRVRIDHGYSSLASGTGKFYDFTVYIYKDD